MEITTADVAVVLQRLAGVASAGGVSFQEPTANVPAEELLGRWAGIEQCLAAGAGLTPEALADLQTIYNFIEAVIIGCGAPDSFDVYEVCFEALSKIDQLLHAIVPPEYLVGLLESIHEIYDVLLSCIETCEWVDPGATGLLRLYMLQVVFACFGHQNVTGRILMELTSNDISGTVGLVAFVLRCNESSFDLQSAAARCLVDLTSADSVFFTEEAQGREAEYQNQQIQKLTEMLNRHVNGLIKSVIQFDVVNSFGHCICQHQQSHLHTDIIVKFFLTTIHNCLLYCSANQQKLRQHLATQSTIVQDIMIPYVDNLLPALFDHPNLSAATLEWQTLKSTLQTFVVVTFNIDVFRPHFVSSDMMMMVMEVPGILANLTMLELILKISSNVDFTQAVHRDAWLAKLTTAVTSLDPVMLARLQRRLSDQDAQGMPYTKLPAHALGDLAIAFQEPPTAGAAPDADDEMVVDVPAEGRKLQAPLQDSEFQQIAAQQIVNPEPPSPSKAAGQASLLGHLPDLANPEKKEKKVKNKVRITSRSVIDAPEEMRCQIDGKVAINPVRSPYGHLFERKTLEKWIQSCGSVCPVTQQPLRIDECQPDGELKKRIVKFLKSQQDA